LGSFSTLFATLNGIKVLEGALSNFVYFKNYKIQNKSGTSQTKIKYFSLDIAKYLNHQSRVKLRTK